ncbi:MAG: CNP1-like family protein [Thiohalocapsa sp.]
MRSIHPRPSSRRCAGAGLALLVLTACMVTACGGRVGGYRDTPFKPDPEAPTPRSVTDGRQWQEGDYALPAWPRDDDLVEVKLDGPQQPLTHYIDTRSLRTDPDGVVRYTLVTESPSGARNLSFEGLRCTPQGRWKTYAFGADGRFTRTQADAAWVTVSKTGNDPLHYDLWRHYLCIPLAFEARPKRDQVRMLESGRVPQVENARFLPD